MVTRLLTLAKEHLVIRNLLLIVSILEMLSMQSHVVRAALQRLIFFLVSVNMFLIAVPGQADDRAITVIVKDNSSAHPIADVQINAESAFANSNRTWTIRSNSEGKASLPWDEAGWHGIHLKVFASGYAPASLLIFPANLTNSTAFISLQKSINGGGMVLNQSGQPISNAQVLFLTSPATDSVLGRGSTNIFHSEITDQTGRWHSQQLPPLLSSISIKVIHPDYAGRTFQIAHSSLPEPEMVSERALMDGVASMLLEKGIPLRGTIVNWEDEPIEGARITGGDFPVWTPYDGSFLIRHCRRGRIAISIKAQGYAEIRQVIEVEPGMKPLRFNLDRSQGLKVKVTDTKGRALPNALVRADHENAPGSIVWSGITDSQGCIFWNSAPRGRVLASVSRPGFIEQMNLLIPSDGQEQTILLRKPLVVTGTVLDGISGMPISEFRIVPGQANNNHYHWDYHHSVLGRSGTFQLDAFNTNGHVLIRVDASGYQSAISRILDCSKEEEAIEFHLSKRKAPQGGSNGNFTSRLIAGQLLSTQAGPVDWTIQPAFFWRIPDASAPIHKQERNVIPGAATAQGQSNDIHLASWKGEDPDEFYISTDGKFRIEAVRAGRYIVEVHHHQKTGIPASPVTCKGVFRTQFEILPGSEPVELGQIEAKFE